MAEAKTRPTEIKVDDFLAAVEPADKRTDALALDRLFRKVAGFTPRMWGPTIIGYGRYAYTYESGHSGEAPACGFSPRKAEHALYIGAGDEGAAPLLARLGKYKIGKSCLYVKRLGDIDAEVLAQLIADGLVRLGQKWPVHPA
jgi:Domain of unknown function (DU1801)